MANRLRDLILVIALITLPAPPLPAQAATPQDTITTPSGLGYRILKQGEGASAQVTDRLSVHYTGWLTDGKKFDSSLDRGEPFQFDLGVKQVIAGWDEGLSGMRVGEKRRLTIPPELGYGEQGVQGIIPPHSILIFDVELLKIEKAGD